MVRTSRQSSLTLLLHTKQLLLRSFVPLRVLLSSRKKVLSTILTSRGLLYDTLSTQQRLNSGREGNSEYSLYTPQKVASGVGRFSWSLKVPSLLVPTTSIFNFLVPGRLLTNVTALPTEVLAMTALGPSRSIHLFPYRPTVTPPVPVNLRPRPSDTSATPLVNWSPRHLIELLPERPLMITILVLTLPAVYKMDARYRLRQHPIPHDITTTSTPPTS